MKKTLGIMALLAMTLGMVGCDDYVTPKGVVETAAFNLHKGDVKAYKKAFTDEALATFGTKAGMKELATKLNGLIGLRLEDAKFVSEKPVRNNGFQVAVRTWSVGIVAKSGAKDSRVMEATVLCDIFTMQGCMGSNCRYDSSEELTECKISAIK